MKGHVPAGGMASVVFGILESKSYDESPLLIALSRRYYDSVVAFGWLIKDCMSNDKLSNMVFELLVIEI